MSRHPRLVHVTTTDISLALLLGPQLRAFAAAGYEVLGASAPGPYVPELEAMGVRHLPLRHATRAMAPHQRSRPHVVRTSVLVCASNQRSLSGSGRIQTAVLG